MGCHPRTSRSYELNSEPEITQDFVHALIAMASAAKDDHGLYDEGVVKETVQFLTDEVRRMAKEGRRAPPSSDSQELTVLAAMFDEDTEKANLDNLLEIVRLDHFANDVHRYIFLACKDTLHRNSRPTIPRIERHLTDRNQYGKQAIEVVTRIDDKKPPNEDAIRDATSTLADYARRRKLISLAQDVEKYVSENPNFSFDDVLGELQKRINDVAEQERAHSDTAPIPHFKWVSEPPPREWVIPGWLPKGRLVLFVGEGGRGKSRLAVQLAASLATGRSEWLGGGTDRIKPPRIVPERVEGQDNSQYTKSVSDGSSPAPATVVLWSAEDEPDEVNRRIVSLCKNNDATGIELDSLGDRLRLIPAMSSGPLWAPKPDDRWSLGEITPHGLWLRRYCEVAKPRLLIIDPLVSAFGCNENARAEVRLFTNSWDAWGIRNGISILIVAHPAKNSNSEYSGSSDWWSAVRNLWSFGLHTNEKKKPGDSDTAAPLLRCSKANYAGSQSDFWICRERGMWKAGSFEDACKEPIGDVISSPSSPWAK